MLVRLVTVVLHRVSFARILMNVQQGHHVARMQHHVITTMDRTLVPVTRDTKIHLLPVDVSISTNVRRVETIAIPSMKYVPIPWDRSPVPVRQDIKVQPVLVWMWTNVRRGRSAGPMRHAPIRLVATDVPVMQDI